MSPRVVEQASKAVLLRCSLASVLWLWLLAVAAGCVGPRAAVPSCTLDSGSGSSNGSNVYVCGRHAWPACTMSSAAAMTVWSQLVAAVTGCVGTRMSCSLAAQTPGVAAATTAVQGVMCLVLCGWAGDLLQRHAPAVPVGC